MFIVSGGNEIKAELEKAEQTFECNESQEFEEILIEITEPQSPLCSQSSPNRDEDESSILSSDLDIDISPSNILYSNGSWNAPKTVLYASSLHKKIPDAQIKLNAFSSREHLFSPDDPNGHI